MLDLWVFKKQVCKRLEEFGVNWKVMLLRHQNCGRAEQLALYEERRRVIFEQLDKLTSRARLLQRCMVVFYVAVGIFIATSVAIGVVAVSGTRYQWIPIVTGLIGACFLFYGSMLLIFEARLALTTIHMEMDFIWKFSKHLVPQELAERHKPHFVHFRRRD